MAATKIGWVFAALASCSFWLPSASRIEEASARGARIECTTRSRRPTADVVGAVLLGAPMTLVGLGFALRRDKDKEDAFCTRNSDFCTQVGAGIGLPGLAILIAYAVSARRGYRSVAACEAAAPPPPVAPPPPFADED